MLSPSSPAQKSLAEEDSSGSDAGSEVGLEPETDRFGFIVTNGSTAGFVGPPPELVRQREAKWINIISQWDRVLLKKTNKVKVQCQKGIPASLRAKCWPLLCGASDKMKQNESLYQSLDSLPALQSWVDVIERDLDRQFPFHEMFLSKDGHGQRGLFRVLKAYTQYQPEEGYCQAQGPVAAVLLMNMPAEEAFWCLVQISEQYLPGYYSPLLEGVLFDAAILTWVLKRTCPAAHKHLQRHGVEPLMFATDWLMCLFTRHLPFNTLLRVWDLFFCYGVRVLLQVAVVLVRRVLGRAEQRKQCQGQMETLEKLRGVREEVQEEDDAFIAEVCSVQLSARDLEKQTEKELEKWRKDRPSSTFDPRGRCQGYRMAWARARHNEEEQERKAREKGNLSVPLARSASTLSLSPSLLHKRWKKGGKANTGDWEGGKKVVRHLSMGAKEDWKSWNDIDFKTVQGVKEEEDVVSEEHMKQSESKLTGQCEQKEAKETDEVQNIPTVQIEEPAAEQTNIQVTMAAVEDEGSTENVKEIPTVQVEETVTVQEEIEQVETRISEREEKDIDEIQNISTVQVEEPAPEQTNIQVTMAAVEDEGSTENVKEIPTVQVEETVTVKEETEQMETKVYEREESKLKETEDSKVHSEQTEEANMETEPTQDPTRDQTVESIYPTSHHKQEEELDSLSQSQDLEQEGGINEHHETEDEDANKETEEQAEHAAVEKNLTEMQKDADADTNTGVETEMSVDPCVEQVIQAEVTLEESTGTDDVQQASETINETCLESEMDGKVEASAVKDPTAETETQQQQEEEITVRDKTLQGKYHSAESLTETDTNEESHTQSETETDELAQTQEQVEANAAAREESEVETDQADSERHVESKTEDETLTLSSPECIQTNESTDLVGDTQTEAEMPVAGDVVTDSREEKEPDTEASELAQETEGGVLTAHSEVQVDNEQTQAEETPTESQTNVESADSTVPPQNEANSTHDKEVNPTADTDENTSPVEVSTSAEAAPEQANIQVTMGAVEEEGSTENVKENAAGEDDVFVSTEPTDPPNTDSTLQDSHPAKDWTEQDNSGLIQAVGRRSSRSSADFCVRKSSSSRGSRLGRRLSEDLFIMPQKPSPSESVPDHTDVKQAESQSNPADVSPTQTPPDVTLEVATPTSEEVTERTAEQPEPDRPKRFGLFRRLRGEQPKNAKAKGAPKMQVPKILIQDFSDGTGSGKLVEEEVEEKLSSRERRRRRRERERKEKEEEKLRKKREKDLERERERERRKPQTRGKSFQVQREKGSSDVPQPEKARSQRLRHSASYAESYF